jgi:hypothetical protein
MAAVLFLIVIPLLAYAIVSRVKQERELKKWEADLDTALARKRGLQNRK